MKRLPSPTTVVTAGAGLLADAVEAQAVETRRVDWQPPQGDPAALAAVLADARRRDANARALAVTGVHPRQLASHQLEEREVPDSRELQAAPLVG